MLVTSSCFPVPLKTFIESLPEAEAKEPKDKKAKKAADAQHELLVAELPWLQELDAKVGFSETGAGKQHTQRCP